MNDVKLNESKIGKCNLYKNVINAEHYVHTVILVKTSATDSSQKSCYKSI